MKIDYANGAGTGDIIWHLGYQGDFTLLNADGSTDTNATDWFYAQHGPSFVTTNTSGKFSLVLFDNGDDRASRSLREEPAALRDSLRAIARFPFCSSTKQPRPRPCHSIQPRRTIPSLGETPKFSRMGTWSTTNALQRRLPANNAAIYEVTQASPPQTVWQMHIAGQYAYRGFRMPSLYPGVQW